MKANDLPGARLFIKCAQALVGDVDVVGWKGRIGHLLGIKNDTIDAFSKGDTRVPPGVWQEIDKLLAERRKVPWVGLGKEVAAHLKVMAKTQGQLKAKARPKSGFPGMSIFTWQCQRCGWANDNNNGPCRKCGALE